MIAHFIILFSVLITLAIMHFNKTFELNNSIVIIDEIKNCPSV